jgi:hypothetical protein
LPCPESNPDSTTVEPVAALTCLRIKFIRYDVRRTRFYDKRICISVEKSKKLLFPSSRNFLKDGSRSISDASACLLHLHNEEDYDCNIVTIWGCDTRRGLD